jgi:MerR family copper efflux transcriptional regulator
MNHGNAQTTMTKKPDSLGRSLVCTLVEKYKSICPLFSTLTHEAKPYLYIGKVAKMTGTTCKAIRHYETLGLLPKAQRQGIYRIYSERDVFLIHMIKCSQSVGFKLLELKELLKAKISQDEFPLQLANALFDRKRAALQSEIEALNDTKQRLADLQAEMNGTFGGT